VAVLLRYWHTVRHLKLIQLYNRLRFLIYKPKLKFTRGFSTRRSKRQFTQPSQKRFPLLGPTIFSFLNKVEDLEVVGWDAPSIDKLWRYNQHYFDYLNASNSVLNNQWHLALLQRWVDENEPGSGVGWDPYPTSLRIVNWIKWSLIGNKLPAKCVESLVLQARFLMHRIEWHILGNHLFANAKALIFSGLFFNGYEANQWLCKGLKIISDELSEQVLADGGHFERSPMYHAIFLEDILDLINLAETYPGLVNADVIDNWKSIAADMMCWLKVMTHPDGEIALFNDSAFKISPKPERLLEYAKRLSIHSKEPQEISEIIHLSESGYLRVNKNNLALIIDVAKVGPDYLPAHAHADTLSFELSLHGLRVFVNGGTSVYGDSEIRLYERSTAAHNTVVVDNENSSEVWSGFRVARRAYPFDFKSNKTEDCVYIECSHNGYERLNKGLVHTRTWKVSNGCLNIHDNVKGCHSEAFAYYHLSPDAKIFSIDANEIILLMKNGEKVRLNYLGSSFNILDGYYAPEFGKRLPNQYLKIGLDALEGSSLQVSWDF